MDDSISRQGTLGAVARIAKAYAKSDAQKSLCGRIMYYIEHADSAPNDNCRKTGHWIVTGFKVNTDVTFYNRSTWTQTYKCSECGSEVRGSIKNFCCDCGADMRGDTK